MVPFLHIKQGDGTVNHNSKTQGNCSTIFRKVWGCIHTYFFTSVFPWNQCLWKWGTGNKKNPFSWNKLQVRKLLPFSPLHWDAGLEPALFTAHTGACHLWSHLWLETRISLPCGRPSSTPFRSRHQPRTKQSINYSWEGKGLKKGTCWSFSWGDIILLSEKALRICFALPADSSLRGKHLLCKSIINMADT